MKKIVVKLLTVTFLTGFIYSCNESMIEEPISETPELKSGQNVIKSYIVQIDDVELNLDLPNQKGFEKREAAITKAASIILERANVPDALVDRVYNTALKGFSVKMPPAQVYKLENDPAVVSIEEDKIVTLIEPKTLTVNGDITTSSETTPWGITRVNGGITYDSNSTGNVVWIIDTGIDYDHPDLNVDASRGAYFVGGVSSADDDHGHGTHVAGTVAAIGNNGTGVIGVAAGATVIPVKVLDRRGGGTMSGVIDGIDFVAANASDGDVANMSLGGGKYSLLDNAVKKASDQATKKIYFSLAAGNESQNANNVSPARANGTYIYTVSAMDSNDKFAYFSNYANPPVDYCEPGVNIYSTYSEGRYATASGTSMAAPHMAGLLLLRNVVTSGNVTSDPDGTADPIGVYSNSNNEPENAAPNASFTYSASDLAVNFSDKSSDPDGTITSWNWNLGDGSTSAAQNPGHTYASGGTYTVTLTVTDNQGIADKFSNSVTVSEPTPEGITVSAYGYKDKGTHQINLNWSGATSSNVEIYLGGKILTTTANDGAYTYTTNNKGKGTYTFKVSEVGSNSASNEVTVTF